MRALLGGEDRLRYEQLVAEVEQAVWEMESVTADLARVIATGIGDALPRPAGPVELSDVVAAALRGVGDALVSRGLTVDVAAAPAVLALGDRERLEHLLAVALSVAASAAQPGGGARVACAASGGSVDVTICPYRARDPRTVIVAALAHSQGAVMQSDDSALILRLHAAVSASQA